MQSNSILLATLAAAASAVRMVLQALTAYFPVYSRPLDNAQEQLASASSVTPLAEFVAALHRRWRVRKICTTFDDPDIHFSLDWSVWMDNDRLLVGLMDREGQAVVLEADLRDSAAFALWFRSLVPVEQELLFCDESYSGSVELTSETTEQQVVAAIP